MSISIHHWSAELGAGRGQHQVITATAFQGQVNPETLQKGTCMGAEGDHQAINAPAATGARKRPWTVRSDLQIVHVVAHP
jgi:hypothetical protein